MRRYAIPLLRLPAGALLAALLLVSGFETFPLSAAAQIPGLGIGGSENEGSRESMDMGGLIEALGRWLVHAIHGEKTAATVENPRWNGTGSPRQTVMTFLENVEYLRQGHEAAWPRVRSTLPASGSLATREKAITLARVFDRLPRVHAYRLADREETLKQGIARYRVFPGALDHRAVWEALDTAPQGRIVLLRGEDGHWRFSPQTLEEVDALLSSIARIPPRVNRQGWESGFPPFFDTRVLPEERADWVIVAVLILAAAAGGLGLAWGMNKLARRLPQGRRVARVTLNRLAAPTAALVILIGIVAAGSTLALHPAVSSLRWQVTGLLFSLVLAFFVYRLVPVLGETLGERHGKHVTGTAVPLLVRILQVAVLVVAAAIVIDGVFSINLTGLIAGFGILGLALGLAAKESVRNWFGAATIYLAKPFTRGDWIIYQGTYARVESIGLNATKLHLASGDLLTVPNMRFIDQEVQNTTERPYIRREMNLAIPYDTSSERMDEVLKTVREALSQDEVATEGGFEEVEREPHVTFSEFKADHLMVRAYYWYRVEPGESGWYSFLEHCDTANRTLLRALEEREIALAFPTRTLRLANDEEEGLRLAGNVQAESDS